MFLLLFNPRAMVGRGRGAGPPEAIAWVGGFEEEEEEDWANSLPLTADLLILMPAYTAFDFVTRPQFINYTVDRQNF